MSKHHAQSGFTLIEILISLLIFGLSITAIVQSRTSSLRNSLESQRMFEAAQLAESKMTEMELKYQTKLDRDGADSVVGTENGGFDAPFEKFKWKIDVKPAEIKFTRALISNYLKTLGLEEDVANDQADQLRVVLANLNKLIENNYVEMKLNIQWEEFGRKRSIPIVTHIIPTTPKIELQTTGEE